MPYHNHAHQSNLRKADPVTHKFAIAFQRCYKKVIKAELDLKFLHQCKDRNVYPKFVRWKNLKTKDTREKIRYYRRLLNDSITEKSKHLKTLRDKLSVREKDVRSSTTWVKFMLIKYSVKRLSSLQSERIKKRHQKKMDALMVEKKIKDGINQNPNELITNLTGRQLTDEEIEILKVGLKHGIASRPRESEMIVMAEDIWDQIQRLDVCKDNFMSKHRAKNALRAFTYNYLDLNDKQFISDSKRLKVLKSLKKDYVLLKPDKGQGIVVLKREDYVSSVQRIFDDQRKFKKVYHDLTLRNLSTIQGYLSKLFNRGEFREDDKKLMRPRSAQIGRAHRLPKIHKEFTNLPPFRPIIDTTNTPYYEVGKFLTSLLQPLTKNQYVVKDSFEAEDRIKDIPKEYFEQGYKYVSFDVESLFTSVPLKKTIQVILDRVYQEEKIITNLHKRTLKKLLKDACHKTTFSFNNVLYEQIDGVSMGSPLGPTMAYIIMTELERIIVDDLMADGVIKFYMRYVDDTLVLIKPEDIQKVLDKLNSFDKNLRFTHDPFSDGDIHFLDIRIRENTTDIYYKDTHNAWLIDFCHKAIKP